MYLREFKSFLILHLVFSLSSRLLFLCRWAAFQFDHDKLHSFIIKFHYISTSDVYINFNLSLSNFTTSTSDVHMSRFKKHQICSRPLF